MIERVLFNKILNDIHKQKVSFVVGARRVGKTELLLQIKQHLSDTCLWMNGEDEFTASILSERTVANYKKLLQGKKVLIIDEAQYIEDIGRKVKLMIDQIKPLHIILTGSSSFDLTQNAGEPLVGRNITNHMYPIAQLELAKTENIIETKENLSERIIYGSYPEVINLKSFNEKKEYLHELTNAYLLKDILAFESIRNPQKIKDLLSLIAYQTGSEVSLDELGRKLSISKNTVERYLDLLSKVFIIYKRQGFSRNLRKEITKSSKWYYFDNGIRNAIINNFSDLSVRQDSGLLWENYIMSERLKRNDYSQTYINSYFWRTYDQQEIDLIEVKDQEIAAYEMKWNNNTTKIPVAFEKAYPTATYKIINKENYEAFII